MKKKLLKSALAVALKALKRAKRKNRDIADDRDSLQEAYSTMHDLAQRASSAVEDLSKQNAEIRGESDVLKDNVSRAELLCVGLERERDVLRSDVERLEQQYNDLNARHNAHLLEVARTEMHLQNLTAHLQAVCWNFDVSDDYHLAHIHEEYKAYILGGGAEYVVNIKPSIGEEGYQEKAVSIAVDGDESAHIVDWTPTPAGDATLDADVANCTVGVNSPTQDRVAEMAARMTGSPGSIPPEARNNYARGSNAELVGIGDTSPAPTKEQIDAVNAVEARYCAIGNAHGNVDYDRVVGNGKD